MTEKKIDDVVQARKRLCEIASDLEYYRAVASYEMPESPNPPNFGGDDEDCIKFKKEDRRWRRKMDKWDEKFQRQLDAQNQVMDLEFEARDFAVRFPVLQTVVDTVLAAGSAMV